jgi:hypothetical protein
MDIPAGFSEHSGYMMEVLRAYEYIAVGIISAETKALSGDSVVEVEGVLFLI